MSKIKLTGSNSGYVEIASAADAGNLTLTLPTGGTALLGNAGNVFSGITTTGQLDINGSIDVSSTSVFNDDLTLTGASYNVVWDKSDNQLEFGANAKLSFGGSSDMQIYHDGNHSYIDDSGTGNLRLRSGTLEVTNLAGSKTSAIFSSGGGQTLNFNNSTKFVTTNTGAVVTGICTATSFSGSGENLTRTTPLSHRNIIINGDFQIAQRSSLNTAVTATTDSQYLSVDRFRWRTYGGAGRASFTQVSGDYPSSDFRYSLKAICTTVNSSEDQYDQAIGYHVEGYDMQRFGWGRSNPKNCTLSFWAKTSVAGTYCVSFRQGAATRSQIKEYTLSAKSWTMVVLTITGDADSTWLDSDYTTNGKGILIEWNLGKSNSKNTSTVNSWISGNKVASNNHCLLYTSPSPRDKRQSRMPSSA